MNTIKKKYDNILQSFRLPLDANQGVTFNTIPKCPRCQIGKIEKIEGVYYGFCDYCPDKSTYFCFWKPLPHQEIVLKLNSKWIFNFGAMGTGKTDASCGNIFQHLIEVTNAYVLVIANDLTTARDILTASLLKFLPKEFIRSNETQPNRPDKTKDKITLKNGSTIQIFSSLNPETYRGRNATKAYALEANTISQEVVEQLEGRIRNEQQMIFLKDKNNDFIYEKDEYGISRKKTLWEFGQILVESNPDEGSWIFKQGLLRSKKIIHSYHVQGINNYKNIDVKKDYSKTTVISASHDNKYIGLRFLKGLSEWDEISRRKHMFGEFVVDGSPVWPTIKQQETKNMQHNKDWPHIFAGDWGVTNDPVCFIHGFLDPNLEKIIIWKCEYLHQKSISKVGYHLQKYLHNYNYAYDKKIIDSAIWSKDADYYIDGGKSIAQQLNSYPLNLGISKANKRIKEGEDALQNLIIDNLILFDTMGEGVLELLENLSKVHRPKGNDTTKRGANKSIARIVNDNHAYDSIRYLALSIDNLWIKKEALKFKTNYTEPTSTEFIKHTAYHAVDIIPTTSNTIQTQKKLYLNYNTWLDNEGDT